MSKYIDADALDEIMQNAIVEVTKITENNYGKITVGQVMVMNDMKNIISQKVCKIPAADVERWISVDERLPETIVDKEYRGGNFTGEPQEVIEHTVSDQVLVAIEDWYNRIIIDIDFIYEGEWDSYDERDVIAWMPLPEPPKMDGGNEKNGEN